MNLYRDEAGHWTGTQADAKLTGAPWALVEVPVDKAGLIAFLNNMEIELRDKVPTFSMDADVYPELPPPLMKVVSAPPTAIDVYKPHKIDSSADVVEEILASTGQLFGTYLNATIDRLGELRNDGFDALAVLRKQVRSFPDRAATERGLGYFLLGDV